VDDLFTIISVVIAVSGATYAALVAIRDYLGKSVRDLMEVASTQSDAMRDATNDKLKATSLSYQGWLRYLNRIWAWSYGVPILIFALISYCQAAHVIAAYWTVTDTKPSSGWAVYKWVLIAMTVIDFLCILATIAAYGGIRFVCWLVRGNHDAELAGRAKDLGSGETIKVEANSSSIGSGSLPQTN
jgi:hypothetical protein